MVSQNFIWSEKTKCVPCFIRKVFWMGWMKSLSAKNYTSFLDLYGRRFGWPSSHGSQNWPRRRLQMWWSYLSNFPWGRSRAAEKPIVLLIVLFLRGQRVLWEKPWVLDLPLTSKKELAKKEETGTGEGVHVVLDYITSKEGWILGSDLYPKFEENRFHRFP